MSCRVSRRLCRGYRKDTRSLSPAFSRWSAHKVHDPAVARPFGVPRLRGLGPPEGGTPNRWFLRSGVSRCASEWLRMGQPEFSLESSGRPSPGLCSPPSCAGSSGSDSWPQPQHAAIPSHITTQTRPGAVGLPLDSVKRGFRDSNQPWNHALAPVGRRHSQDSVSHHWDGGL